jgi:hypothetical protein
MDDVVARAHPDGSFPEPFWKGPVSELPSTAAKLFASAYAVFSGLVFMSLMGIFLVPVAHRMLHRFHMDDTDTLAKSDQGQ